MKGSFQWCKITVTACLLLFVLSCNNGPADIPLPSEFEFPQPLTVAFHFSDSSTLKWPDSFRTFKPIVKKFDFNKLPERIFDSSGFFLFAKKPEEIRFNWQNLKDTVFNYAKLPSKPLRFETLLTDPPKLIRAPHPYLKKGSSSMVYEFGEMEGLIGNNANCLLEDKNGMIWIATDQGVFRYDGENFLKYLQISPDWSVLNMLEDNQGNIWLGTGGNNGSDGRGIFIINNKSSMIRHLSVSQGLLANFILDMRADQQGRIWISTYHYPGDANGINIIDEKEQQIKQFSRHEGLSLNNVRNILRDNKNNMWIATRGGGMNIVDLKNGRIRYLRKEDGLLNDSLTNLVMDSLNRIWISTRRGYINMVDVEQGMIRQYGRDQGLHLNYTGNLLCDRKGEIWIATYNTNGDIPGNGIEIIDPEKGAIKIINTSDALRSNDITRILQDKLGQIWIATFSGLNFLNKGGNEISHAGNNEITAITEDETGKIWLAYGYTSGVHGMEILDPKTGISKKFTTAQGLVNDSMQTVLIHGGKIWITTNGGIDMVDFATNTIEQLREQDILGSSFPTSPFIADDGKLWLGKSAEPDMDIIDMGKNTIGHLTLSIHQKDTAVTDIKRDRLGRIWVSTKTGGIYMIEQNKNKIKYINIKNLSESQIDKFLLPDDQNNMWITTGKGIFIVNAAADSITHISTKEGLPGDNIVSINKNNNLIFAGTGGGIAVITSPAVSADKKWNVESFGKSEGINKFNTNVASDFITRDGQFLWGDNGLTKLRIHPQNGKSAGTYITGLDIFNQPQYFTEKTSTLAGENDTLWSFKRDTFYLKSQIRGNRLFPQQDKMQWDSLSDAYNMPVNLRLPYYQNYLQLHFTQVNLGRKDTSWYRYILLGADKKWSEKTYNSFSQNYLNLSPGEYIFKVSSIDRGRWGEPAVFRFTVLPPWWQSWWAYVMDVLVIAGFAWIFARYRSRKLQRENLVLEERIVSRTTQLQQSLEELKNTQTQLIQSEKMASLGELTAGIAHEIQNPLNFMNNFSEVNKELIDEMEQEMDKGNLGDAKIIAKNIRENEAKINHHGKRADAIVKGMLQHSRSGVGVKEPTGINVLADEYLRLSYQGLRAKDKSFNVIMETDYDQSIGNINIIPQDIGRVLLNLYNNAFYAVSEKKKQLSNGYEPTVSVSTKKLNSKVEIRVKDNGNGIPQKVLNKIFQPFFTTKPAGQGTGLGLSLSYDIIKAHGGEIKAETEEGEFTEFVIQIPVTG